MLCRRLSTSSSRRLKSRQLVDVTIDSLDIHGAGVGTDIVSQNRCAVNGAIPGQRIKGRVIKDNVSPALVAQMELVAQSPDYIEPLCKYFTTCGGCKTQHFPYEKQVDSKDKAIQSTLNVSDLPAMKSAIETFGYRNKMEFTYSTGRWLTQHDTVQVTKQATIGLFPKSQGSRRWDGRVIALDNCALQSAIGNRLLQALWKALDKVPPYDFIKHNGFLRHIVIRVGTTLQGKQNILLGFGTATISNDTTKLLHQALDQLFESFKQDLDALVSIVQFMDDEMIRRHKKAHGELPEQTFQVLHGLSYMNDTILNKQFRVSLHSFFQPNTAMASVLYDQIAQCINQHSPSPIVWDLFCGVGSIGICIAEDASHVVGIDIVPEAIIDAKANAIYNNVADKMTFVCQDLLLDGIPSDLPSPDIVIVDPPRAGLSSSLLCFLSCTIKPPTIVYVSCNVVSQAKDLVYLLEDYEITRLQPKEVNNSNNQLLFLDEHFGIHMRRTNMLRMLELSMGNTAAREGSGFLIEASSSVDPRKPRGRVLGSFAAAECTPLPSPQLVCLAPSALKLLNAQEVNVSKEEWMDLIAGTGSLIGLAHCYAGHQFGHFSGQLGDGAAILLGGVNGYEAQLKGAGLTAFSRTADGRKVLRSTLREFLASEHMHALNIPTTRAGGVVVSGTETALRDKFYDGNASHEPVANVLRIAQTFLRFGSFEIFKPVDAITGRSGPLAEDSLDVKIEKLEAMVKFVAETYYGVPQDLPFEDKAKSFLNQVTERTARLVAKWQAIGFCHGVLNTDNMSIVGDTLDYGPYGYMEHFDPQHICNTSDTSGRYMYEAQPEICKWNIHVLHEQLQILFSSQVNEAFKLMIEETFDKTYSNEFQTLVHAKLGIEIEDDTDLLVGEWWATLADTHADFTCAFRALSLLKISNDESKQALIDELSSISFTFDQAIRAMKPSVSPPQLLHLRQLLVKNPRMAAQYGINSEILDKLESDLTAYTALVESGDTNDTYLLKQKSKWELWVNRYAEVIARQGIDDDERSTKMNQVNPKFILRNHVAQATIEAAERHDLVSVDHIIQLITNPFDEGRDCDSQLYGRPLDPTKPPLMVSCSS
ncbi:selenoprotein O [Thraustotheca clavata]|uniref:Selenoprotein O n=1 Tax=Thraustotheca clavata TaxID=74557 RepID=A0A1V9ZPX3_9STRA|nr:selenoprotein O [Thraustotheca clavata]